MAIIKITITDKPNDPGVATFELESDTTQWDDPTVAQRMGIDCIITLSKRYGTSMGNAVITGEDGKDETVTRDEIVAMGLTQEKNESN